MFPKIEFDLTGFISPSTISFLVPKTFFPHTQHLCLLLCASLFWFELLGVEEAQNWLDKPSEERNLTDISRGVGKSSMQTLKSTGREGMTRRTV